MTEDRYTPLRTMLRRAEQLHHSGVVVDTNTLRSLLSERDRAREDVADMEDAEILRSMEAV